MKKITFLFILVMFVLSIFIVNFFGLPAKNYNANIFVEKIEIENVSVDSEVAEIVSQKYNKNGIYEIEVNFFSQYDPENESKNMIVITPRCIPDKAGNKSLDYQWKLNKSNLKNGFIVDEEDYSKIVVCMKEIKKDTPFDFTIKAGDGNGASVRVAIYANLVTKDGSK